MPTGYTSIIYEEQDVTFKQFAMGCARAFGALITLRDEAMNAEIPEKFEPSQHYATKVDKIEKHLSFLKHLSLKHAEREAKKEYKEHLRRREETIREHKMLETRYRSMLCSVEEWNPPTTNHVGLKNFMIDQLKKSIDGDCNTTFLGKKEVSLLSPQQWIDKELNQAYRDLEYYSTERIKEIQRVEERNTWLKQLRDSLK